MVDWPAGSFWLDALEAEVIEIEFIGEGFNNSDGVLFSNIIIECFRE